jgi:3-isopropylmalate/(R)-2-methylmalate dehydratase small subunit
VALGIPCLTAKPEDVQKLKRAVAADPSLELVVDVEKGSATAGSVGIPVEMPAGAKKQLVSGRWDSSTELLEGKDAVASTAKALPYFAHWA